MRVALRTLGLPDATADEATATLHKYDADGDGRLDLGEFGLLVSELATHQAEQAARQAELLVEPKVRQAYELFDGDHSGGLSARELGGALDRLGVQGGAAEASARLHRYDADA